MNYPKISIGNSLFKILAEESKCTNVSMGKPLLNLSNNLKKAKTQEMYNKKTKLYFYLISFKRNIFFIKIINFINNIIYIFSLYF